MDRIAPPDQHDSLTRTYSGRASVGPAVSDWDVGVVEALLQLTKFGAVLFEPLSLRGTRGTRGTRGVFFSALSSSFLGISGHTYFDRAGRHHRPGLVEPLWALVEQPQGFGLRPRAADELDSAFDSGARSDRMSSQRQLGRTEVGLGHPACAATPLTVTCFGQR
jgi:hypothetical protein